MAWYLEVHGRHSMIRAAIAYISLFAALWLQRGVGVLKVVAH